MDPGVELLTEEQHIRFLNRFLRTIKEIDQLMVRAADTRELLDGACRIAVEHGEFRLAWVGTKQPSGEVGVAAAYALTPGYVEGIKVRWDEGPLAQGPTGVAIREERTTTSRDTWTDPEFAPWRERAHLAGYRSSAAAPIRVEGEVIGAFTIYAAVPRAFGPDVLPLVEELAQDLGYALEGIANRRRRDEALEALRASERRYHVLFELNPFPLWVHDSASGRILAANEAAVRGYGYGREELLQMKVDALLAPSEAASLGAPGPEAGELGRVRHLTKSGRVIDVELTSHEIDLPSGRACLVVACDRTEHDRAARELARARDMLLQAQKMEAVGRLAGGVAHDFNNLLTVILGYGDLLRQTCGASEPGRSEIEALLDAARRASALTRQLLAFSRRQVLSPRVVELNDVVGGIEQMLRRLIGEDVELVTRLGEGVGRVRVDVGQIEQVILNLAINARDAMPGGGRLTVETADVELRAPQAAAREPVPAGRYVALRVRDTGVGMDEAAQRHVFEPFYTTKASGKGTGLGLATVYGIVKQSGGQITLASAPGEGTAFEILLPRVEESVGAPPPSAAASAGGDETILLVEDREDVRGLTVELLRRLGYRVLAAGSGEEALSLAGAHRGPIDLLLTDVVMPHLGGRELARRLLAARPAMRVLFMSGFAGEALAGAAGGAPEALLEKPFTAEGLTRAVRQSLAGPARRQPGG